MSVQNVSEKMGLLKKSWFRILTAVAAVPLLVIGGFVTYLYITQESMIFAGTTLSRDHQFAFDVPFEEVTIPLNGAEISGLHFQQPDPRGLIFFLHGNGGNLDSWTSNVGYYQRVNYDLFIFDYRGYGKSSGRIQNETQLHDDVRAIWDTISPLYRDKPIVIYGRSLGAALAARLARNVKSDLLVLVSPFSSLVAMARRQYPLLPEWVVRYPLRTDKLIADIRTPIMFIHGDEDRFIPPDHTHELRELTIEPSDLLIIEGAGHNDIHKFESYLTGLTNALPN